MDNKHKLNDPIMMYGISKPERTIEYKRDTHVNIDIESTPTTKQILLKEKNSIPIEAIRLLMKLRVMGITEKMVQESQILHKDS